ncbi:MAG: hypothetical protein HC767_07630 [Akkermansiaceae bacterium]|nr:hypothetical protein [Akkermansiaceae bacterium]
MERQGERTALVVTEGFRDLLLIANQTRDSIFELDIQRPDLLYELVAEIEEDVIIPVTGSPSPRNGMSGGCVSRCGTTQHCSGHCAGHLPCSSGKSAWMLVAIICCLLPATLPLQDTPC